MIATENESTNMGRGAYDTPPSLLPRPRNKDLFGPFPNGSMFTTLAHLYLMGAPLGTEG
jgi:hypothetical protein